MEPKYNVSLPNIPSIVDSIVTKKTPKKQHISKSRMECLRQIEGSLSECFIERRESRITDIKQINFQPIDTQQGHLSRNCFDQRLIKSQVCSNFKELVKDIKSCENIVKMPMIRNEDKHHYIQNLSPLPSFKSSFDILSLQKNKTSRKIKNKKQDRYRKVRKIKFNIPKLPKTTPTSSPIPPTQNSSKSSKKPLINVVDPNDIFTPQKVSPKRKKPKAKQARPLRFRFLDPSSGLGASTRDNLEFRIKQMSKAQYGGFSSYSSPCAKAQKKQSDRKYLKLSKGGIASPKQPELQKGSSLLCSSIQAYLCDTACGHKNQNKPKISEPVRASFKPNECEMIISSPRDNDFKRGNYYY
ncbi:unnamed protein product [Moneuplotes crassus]|uniref:Uncharacterized protein n=1 Tax=Euplotes crassus TaxID=5936 RepID=A0AAD1U6F1_EUPCR|nr:unnamed protein product [Moneuplotes crassus]